MSQDEVDNGVVKIYVVGAGPKQMEKIMRFCQDQGFYCHPTKGFGRPRGVYPVRKVMHAFRSGLGVRAVAEGFGLSRRTVQRILEKEGLWPRNNQ